jgi:tRNA pseudouridine38-40 synthase
MPRFKLTIEYAGTRYSGWQIQKNARTVQGELHRVIRLVTGRNDFELYGAGRTDAGVHALGQVAHLDVAASLPPDALRQRCNEKLPADINLLAVSTVPRRFHARHDAVARRYVYQVSRRRTAFAKPYVWWVKEELDLRRIRDAAESLVGMRDFQSFAASDEDDRDASRQHSTLVLIEQVAAVESGDLVLIGVEGSHFLWRMVRRLVGVLVEVGRGALAPKQVAQFLSVASDTPARLTAPAAGLFLESVLYEGDARPAAWTAATPLTGRGPGR